MNEDEAFIRAIVDSPGDDTSRLVYADWLDDRSDPRGTYLRAEHEWAKPWRAGLKPPDSRKLRALMAKLDPLWAARVSRPPLGVCCDHMGIVKSSIQLLATDIDQIERRFNNFAIPIEYRGFLLNYNGGRAKLNSLPHPRLAGIDCELQWSVLDPTEERLNFKNWLGWLLQYRSARQQPYRTLIPMCAADGGYYEAFAIGYGEGNNGRVYHVLDPRLNQFPGKPRKVAATLGKFLASILSRVEPSVIEPS